MALPSFFRSDQWVKNTLGLAVSGAHVYWLNQPVTSLPTSESLVPAPQAAVFTSSTGATPLAQPVVTDGFGHCDAYMATGFYTVAVYVNGSLLASYADQGAAVGAGASGGVSTLNGLSGALAITAGTGITVTPSGSNVQVAGAYVAGTGITITGATIAASGGALPASPNFGDTVRYNYNNDGNWDAVNFAQKFVYSLATSTSGTFQSYGYVEGSQFLTAGVTNSRVNFTATQTYGQQTQFASAASTNMGLAPFGFTSTNMVYNIMNWHRITFTIAAMLPASIRHWWGIFVNGTGTGTGNNTGAANQVLITSGSTVLFTDTPNKTFIAFRYSSGTDTHWKAVCSVAGASSASQTIVDTGITPDTNVHVFEICQNFAQTQITFFIDAALVATITTNIPNGNSANAGDNTAGICFSCDNKNVTSTMGFTWYNCGMTLRG